MSYCSLEEAWNLSDCEDNETDYQNFQQIDNNYFNSPVKNSKDLDLQNHEIKITRNKCKDKIVRNENNFDKYNQMELNNLKNIKNPNVPYEISPNNLNNSQYYFVEDDLENKNINSNEQEIYDNNQNNNVFSEEYENFSDQANENKNKNENENENEINTNKQLTNIDLKVHEKLLINIMERLDAIDKKLSTKKEERNNVHDIILFIVIGIFILFALDSIFRIGRMTV